MVEFKSIGLCQASIESEWTYYVVYNIVALQKILLKGAMTTLLQ